MHNHGNCRFYNRVKEYSVAELAAFHGHLGPYIVIGYRIGRYAREHFCNDPFELHATIYCTGKPPESCIVDGVQLGSGCTFGKRNIEIVQSPGLRCEFAANGRTLVATPKPETKRPGSGHSEAEVERFAEEISYWRDDQIFDIRVK